MRAKRDAAADLVPDWEALRSEAAAIKREALERLPELLDRVRGPGDPRRRRRPLGPGRRTSTTRSSLGSCTERRVTRVVKSKSMLTEECGLNPYLERHGIEVVDTDLGERIVQLRDEPPSHIVMPAIHLRRGEVGETFAREMGAPAGLDDPDALTAIARQDLRARFLAAQAGITGVNFAVAETGSLVVVSNEGNVDLGTALPPLHIACVGLEKIVPAKRDLAVFLRLLARSATGQAISAYTSHFRGPQPGRELHIVLVDNGRSRLLAQPDLPRGARLHPLRRLPQYLSGLPAQRGPQLAAVIPGPIGSVLETAARSRGPRGAAPRLQRSAARAARSAPSAFRSTISCSPGAVCSRGRGSTRGGGAWHSGSRRGCSRGRACSGSVDRLGRRVARALPETLLDGLAKPWTRQRALPAIPAESFRTQWKKAARRRASGTTASAEDAPHENGARRDPRRPERDAAGLRGPARGLAVPPMPPDPEAILRARIEAAGGGLQIVRAAGLDRAGGLAGRARRPRDVPLLGAPRAREPRYGPLGSRGLRLHAARSLRPARRVRGRRERRRLARAARRRSNGGPRCWPSISSS